jgi:hypothetical protein
MPSSFSELVCIEDSSIVHLFNRVVLPWGNWLYLPSLFLLFSVWFEQTQGPVEYQVYATDFLPSMYQAFSGDVFSGVRADGYRSVIETLERLKKVISGELDFLGEAGHP